MQFDFQNIILFDISKYQGYPPKFPVVDFVKMRGYGAPAVIIKAGQRNYADPAFKINWEAVKGILPRHTYWYYDNKENPVLQAEKWAEIMRPDPDGMYWLDLEDREPGDYRGWRKWYDFLERFKRAMGIGSDKIGIYTGFWYFEEETRFATAAQREYFRQYQLWLASYPKDPFKPPYSSIVVPRPWKSDEVLILQSGTPAIGYEVGVHSAEIDYNQFNGSAEKFKLFFGGAPVPPQPPTGEIMIGEVTTPTLNIRPTASTKGDPIGTLKDGDIVEASNKLAGWWRLTKITRREQNITLPAADCFAYEGDTGGLIKTLVAPPPPVPQDKPKRITIEMESGKVFVCTAFIEIAK